MNVELMGGFLIISLILCGVGFYNFVYFMSVGYGLAIVGLAVAEVFVFQDTVTLGGLVLAIILMFYGVRLAGFLLYRELANKNYKQVLSEATKGDDTMPIGIKIAIWVACGILYVVQVAPLTFRLSNGRGDDLWLGIGIVVAVCGLCIETVADMQKSQQKKVRSDMVAMEGLYQLTRCPNYCGEIVFWTGILLTCILALESPLQWIIALLGYVAIVYVMISGAKRLEKKQDKRYGASQEYQEYVAKTPILLPFLPIYHL